MFLVSSAYDTRVFKDWQDVAAHLKCQPTDLVPKGDVYYLKNDSSVRVTLLLNQEAQQHRKMKQGSLQQVEVKTPPRIVARQWQQQVHHAEHSARPDFFEPISPRATFD